MLNDRIASEIFTLLAEREYKPSDLLLELRRRGFSQADGKEAMSYLVHRQRVELTADRLLRAMALAHA